MSPISKPPELQTQQTLIKNSKSRTHTHCSSLTSLPLRLESHLTHAHPSPSLLAPSLQTLCPHRETSSSLSLLPHHHHQSPSPLEPLTKTVKLEKPSHVLRITDPHIVPSSFFHTAHTIHSTQLLSKGRNGRGAGLSPSPSHHLPLVRQLLSPVFFPFQESSPPPSPKTQRSFCRCVCACVTRISVVFSHRRIHF